jgi:peptidase MA superfamily protein
MARSPLARFLIFLAALVALAWPSGARADDGPDLLPRDVSVVVQPDAAKLPSLPNGFERLDHGWIAVELPSSIRDRGDTLLHEADEFRARLSEDFGQPPLERILVRIARTPDQMAELAPPSAPPPAYAAGVAYPSLRLILLALQAPQSWDPPDLAELLRHELTHVALGDAVASHHVPRWFDEGLAIHESGELPWARTKTLWDATLGKRLLPLSYLDEGFPRDNYEVNEAYAESADFVRFLMRDADRARFGSLLQRVRAGVPFDRTLEDAYGADVRKLEYQWREELGRRFGIIPMITGGGVLWVVIAGLAAAAWVKKRRRARAKLAEWAREEAEMDAVLAASRAERESPALAAEDEVPTRMPSIPVVEHDGRWHTLH